MNLAALLLLNFVVPLTSGLCYLLSIVQKVQVSDTTGDATCRNGDKTIPQINLKAEILTVHDSFWFYKC